MSKKFEEMTREERVADADRPRRIDWYALDICVLVVAKEGYCGDWVAYIKNVLGNNHEEETEGVIAYGSKLSEKIARAIFYHEPWTELRYRL